MSNIQGEKICVAKCMNIWEMWDEDTAYKSFSKSVKTILTEWAKSHSDEYDEEYYSLIMSANICESLRDCVMMEDFIDRRFYLDKTKRISLRKYAEEYEATLSLLNENWCDADTFRKLTPRLKSRYQAAKAYREKCEDYCHFKYCEDFRRFNNIIAWIRESSDKCQKYEVRIKKAEIDIQRANYLKEKALLQLQSFIQ